MPNSTSTWWERVAALGAVLTLAVALATSSSSCGGEDLIFSGDIPTFTPRTTHTPTPTEDPDEIDEE